MTTVGNTNLMMVRLDPAYLAKVSKLKKKREKNGAFLRRAIDALEKCAT